MVTSLKEADKKLFDSLPGEIKTGIEKKLDINEKVYSKEAVKIQGKMQVPLTLR